MDREHNLQTLRSEIERIQRSVDRISAMPEVNLVDLYLTKKGAAEFLGICYRTIERWQRQGYIKCTRIGGRVYYMKTELLRIAQLYSSGIGTLSGNAQPQTLSELLLRQDNRRGVRQ